MKLGPRLELALSVVLSVVFTLLAWADYGAKNAIVLGSIFIAWDWWTWRQGGWRRRSQSLPRTTDVPPP
jgi:hypothetical protein